MLWTFTGSATPSGRSLSRRECICPCTGRKSITDQQENLRRTGFIALNSLSIGAGVHSIRWLGGSTGWRSGNIQFSGTGMPVIKIAEI